MQYTYVSIRNPDKDERDRRRASFLALIYLRFHLPLITLVWTRLLFDKRHHASLVEQLLRPLVKREEPLNPKILNWALAYAHPGVLRAVIKTLGQGECASWPEKVLKHTNSKLLLPREYLTPDFQRMQRFGEHAETVLICFTGTAQRLNMPVQLFHCAVAERFDILLYLRDFTRQLFIEGVRGIGADMGKLITSLRQHIPPDCHLSVLGTSGGGIAATHAAAELGAHRLALFSPTCRFKQVHAVPRTAKLNSENALLYFAAYHDKDRKLADEWSRTILGPSIRWLDTDSHGTLSYLANAGHLGEVVTWLLGGTSAGLDRCLTGQRVAATLREVGSPD